MFVGATWNVVTLLFGGIPAVEAVLYLLVGFAGLYELSFAYQFSAAGSAEEPTGRQAA